MQVAILTAIQKSEMILHPSIKCRARDRVEARETHRALQKKKIVSQALMEKIIKVVIQIASEFCVNFFPPTLLTKIQIHSKSEPFMLET